MQLNVDRHFGPEPGAPSVITAEGEFVEIKADVGALHRRIAAEQKFWRHVKNCEPLASSASSRPSVYIEVALSGAVGHTPLKASLA